jgi:two-component system response regulator AtoC
VDTPRKTILIVDDEPQVLDVLSSLLTRAGYIPLVADGPVTALELVAEHTIDGMILDMHLPGLAGMELLTLLRSPATRFTPAIAITGDSSIDADEISAHGFVDLLLKPFTPSELRRVVESNIG